jgi:hypothetical protein
VPAVAERVLKGGVIELYTSHWRSPLLADVDAQIVSISRGEPRWRLPFRFRRLRQLAPGTEAWSHKADREAFENAYQRQLQEIGAEPILERLEEIGAGKPAILLCWERLDKPGEWCHRQLLSRFLLDEAGIVLPELGTGMLAKRPDTPDGSFVAAFNVRGWTFSTLS